MRNDDDAAAFDTTQPRHSGNAGKRSSVADMYTSWRASTSAPLEPTLGTGEGTSLIADYQKEEQGTWSTAAYFILIVELCERLAFYAATIVFYPYMQNMLNMTQSTANALYNAFNCWAYATCLIGGFVADTYFGKVKSLFVFSVSYILGLVVLFVSSREETWSDYPNSPDGGMGIPGFACSLFFIGLGMGGIKANVSPLLADQIKNSSPKVYEGVFRWFYWAINIGAFTGIIVSPMLHDIIGPKKVIDDGDEDGTAYWASYLFPLCVFIVGLLIYFVGYKKGYYVNVAPKGSLLADCYHASMYAIRAKKTAKNSGNYKPKEHWLDWSETSEDYSTAGKHFKVVLSACSVFLFYPVYWLCYNQMFSNLIAQAENLDKPDWVASEHLNVIGASSLIILIPVFDKLIFPGLTNCGYNPKPLTRISIGFAIAGCSMIYAGVLEYYIQDRGYFIGEDYFVDEGKEKIKIWLQIPPYVLFGISEIFASVGGLEFAYTEAPSSMKSVVMSLFLLSNAAGSVIGMIISPAMKPDTMMTVFFAMGGSLVFLTFPFYCIFRSRAAVSSVDKDQGAIMKDFDSDREDMCAP
eukprot:TRINITY_DN10273_c1_g3_i1.p1 TRINITY_DN10273_c1_g3~~TRINITY_DN10273_c1_g3_i1.p1  ORF type:complete len:593 (+),score=96.50 TRINITY_DN10273_c1_g3_i1:42-1781(+)